jgi:hypothetical protein
MVSVSILCLLLAVSSFVNRTTAELDIAPGIGWDPCKLTIPEDYTYDVRASLWRPPS